MSWFFGLRERVHILNDMRSTHPTVFAGLTPHAPRIYNGPEIFPENCSFPWAFGPRLQVSVAEWLARLTAVWEDPGSNHAADS